MKKKDQNTLFIIAIGILAYWFLMKKKTAMPKQQTGTGIAPRMNSAVIEAQADARDMANSIISQTTFVPDFTTDADRYKADKNACK